MSSLQEVVSVTEAAGMLGISTSYVRRLCRLGVLVARESGGVWLIERASVEHYRSRVG